MALELTELNLNSNQSDKVWATQSDLYALEYLVGPDEMWNYINVEVAPSDLASISANGELTVGITPKPTVEFTDQEVPKSFNVGTSETATAYPLKVESSNSASSSAEASSDASGNWADLPAIEQDSKSWDIQTTSGPATSSVDPAERTMLYTDQYGDPVYSNIDGDYLYDDYNGNPVTYSTDAALANGAGAITYGDGSGVGGGSGVISDSGTSAGGMAAGSIANGIQQGLQGAGDIGNSLGGLIGGSSKGSKDGGTGAQVGEGDAVGTRLVNPVKPNISAADYVALENYALIVNQNLIAKAKWEENPLDRYTTYTYRLEWFTIDANHYQTYQDVENKVQFLDRLEDSEKFVIFKTGINTDIVVENFEVKNYYSSNSTYKNVIFSELNMTIHEPSGASLLEVIKEVADEYGYINMASMPYFMKITYVGYVGDGSDDDGQQEILDGYVSYIPFCISKFTPTINLDTKYNIVGHPLSVLAVLKDNFVLKTDISINIPAGSNLGSLLEAVGKEINRQYVESCTKVTKELYKRANKNSSKIYQYAGENISTAIYIDVDSNISKIPIDNNKVKSQFSELSNDGVALNLRFGVGTPLNKIFDEVRKIVSFSSIVDGNVFEDSAGSTATPQDWADICKTFSFEPEARFVGQDPETHRAVHSYVYKLYQKYNPAYMPPFSTTQEKDQAKANKAKYRALLCQLILDSKGLVKRYDSYNTGLNDQVLNVNINMDHLFFVDLPTSGVKTPTAGVKTEIVHETPYENDQNEIVNPSNDVMEFIEENRDTSGLPVQFTTSNVYGTSNSGESVSGSDRAINSIYNEIYRSGGMIKLNLSIKGDPYWISNYALIQGVEKEKDKTCQFKDGLLHLYFRATLPRVTQDYHNDPDGGESVYKGLVNKTISGVYMVVSVVSQFNAGKFTQTIECVMNNNLPMEFNGRITNLLPPVTKADINQNNYQYVPDQNNNYQNYIEGVQEAPNLKKTALGNSPLPEGSYTETSGFGPRTAPTDGASSMHNGVDLAAKAGTPVYSAGDGVVKSVGYGQKSGNYVCVEHPGGYESWYLHLSSADVKLGQELTAGSQLGRVGNTGVSTGAHLHFGVKKDGNWINPESLV